LPNATGSGDVYKLVVETVPTSNSYIIKVARAADAMIGMINSTDDTLDNKVGFYAVAGISDTITLNRSTTGGVTRGETITLTDYAPNLWLVEGDVSNTGTPATPFSNTVS
jgi:hypothetical protein